VAELLDVGSGGFTGEPVGLGCGALRGSWCEFAVDGDGGLERDEGAALLDGEGEGVVEVAGLLGEA